MSDTNNGRIKLLRTDAAGTSTDLVDSNITLVEGQPLIVYDKDNEKYYLKVGGPSGAKLFSLTLEDATVSTNMIQSGAITSDKIPDEAIISDKIATNAITSDKIADEAITSNKIADGAITTTHIDTSNFIINGNNIDTSSITGEKLENGIITNSKMSDVNIDKLTGLSFSLNATDKIYDKTDKTDNSVSISIYAPTSSGTSGRLLVSKGAGSTPTYSESSYVNETNIDKIFTTASSSTQSGLVRIYDSGSTLIINTTLSGLSSS